MKIAAGSAGLATLSHCTSGAYDCKVVCHEKTDRDGCTWVYREEIGSGWFKDTHEHVQKLLGHNVQLVESTNGERKWSIRVKDLQKNAVVNESFDAVMVCNGHYFEPRMPTLIGQNIFQAQQMDSHDYREPEIFTDKMRMVLPVGNGSGFGYIEESAASDSDCEPPRERSYWHCVS